MRVPPLLVVEGQRPFLPLHYVIDEIINQQYAGRQQKHKGISSCDASYFRPSLKPENSTV
jgi:hypothetical protein